MTGAAARARLSERLASLEAEVARVADELAGLGPGEELPGLYLVVEAAGRRALLASALVLRIVRLVALSPVPGAPAAVAGSFLLGGRAVLTVDLAALLGAPREPALDAQIVVLAGARPLGLLVDAVASLVERPVLARGDEALAADPWRSTGLTAGVCTCGGAPLPLLGLGPLLARLREIAA